MANLPEPVQNLVLAFERLPGIGPKSASRLTFHLLRAPDEISRQLAEALLALKSATGMCPVCFNITLAGQEQCEICADARREETTLCVVEEPLDVLVIERTGGFQGKYHVLHGVLSPIEGIGPEDLKIKPLIERVRAGNVREIIIATNPSMEGDATALYLRQQLAPFGVRLTRLARGLPVGGGQQHSVEAGAMTAARRLGDGQTVVEEAVDRRRLGHRRRSGRSSWASPASAIRRRARMISSASTSTRRGNEPIMPSMALIA